MQKLFHENFPLLTHLYYPIYIHNSKYTSSKTGDKPLRNTLNKIGHIFLKHCKEHFYFRIGQNAYLDSRFLCHKNLLIFIRTLKLQPCTKPLMHWNHVLELCIKSCGEELTLFRMCFSGFAHGRRPLPTICDTYSTIMKLDTVIPYLEKTQNIYESRDTPFKFC